MVFSSSSSSLGRYCVIALLLQSLSVVSLLTSRVLVPGIRSNFLPCNVKLDSSFDNEQLIIPPLTYSVFGEQAASEQQAIVKNKPLFARFVSWLLHRFVTSRTQFVQNLQINVLVPSNRHIIRGRIDTLELKFDKIIFAHLLVSGGGRLILKDVDLRMRRFLFQNLQSIRKPYKMHGDFLLTQADIVNSKLIRNLIQLLVDTILQNALSFTNGNTPFVSDQDVVKAVVKKVSIRARRIFASGEVSVSERIAGSIVSNAAGGAMMPFEVSTGAGVKDDGQVLFLRDIQVVLNPDSNFRAVVPIILTSPIDVDLGEEFRLESLVIANKHVWLRANTVISPLTQPFQVTPIKSRAMFHYDLAAFFSGLFKLQGGIALPLVNLWRHDNHQEENNDNDSNDYKVDDVQNSNNNNNNNNNDRQEQQDYPYNRLSLLLPTSMIGNAFNRFSHTHPTHHPTYPLDIPS